MLFSRCEFKCFSRFSTNFQRKVHRCSRQNPRDRFQEVVDFRKKNQKFWEFYIIYLHTGNTTDSAQQQLDSRFSNLGARLQRPQLTKAFTCNPTSSNLGEEGRPSATDIALDCSGLALGTESANGGQNCNGKFDFIANGYQISFI